MLECLKIKEELIKIESGVQKKCNQIQKLKQDLKHLFQDFNKQCSSTLNF